MFQAPKWTHVTLPSVDGVNIIRDPPKSVFTRRITKVGDDDSITNLIDGSGDRVCEAINTYARGVNPMVEVSYNNASNNGGRTGGTSYATTQAQAFLPYRIMDGGAFRAPMVAPTELLPLSRMPRVHTFAAANPGFVDFTKSIMCGTNARNTKKDVIHGSTETKPYYKKQTLDAIDTSNNIKSKLNYGTETNPRGRYTKITLENTVKPFERRRAVGEMRTNLVGMRTAAQHNPETTIVKRNLNYGAYDGRHKMDGMQPVMHSGDRKVVSGISARKPGNVKTRIY